MTVRDEYGRVKPPPVRSTQAQRPKKTGRDRATTSTFRIYSAEELDQFPPVEWHEDLEGFLAKRELTGFFGLGGTKKSFVAQGWAAHIASTGQCVLYIAAEGASGLQARFAAWKRHNGVERLDSLKVMPSPVRMQEEEDVGIFLAAIEEQLDADMPVLVVIDTLGRNFVGGDENSAKDMGLFVEGAERIRRKWECSVLVIHHTTKDGKTERGSQALRNASFAMFSFESSGMKVEVSCSRMKDAAEPAPVRMQMVTVDLGDERSSLVAPWPYGERVVSVPDLIKNAKEDKTKERILEEIGKFGPCSTNKWSKLVRGVGNERKLDLANELREAGLLHVEDGPRDALIWSVVEQPGGDLSAGGLYKPPEVRGEVAPLEAGQGTSPDLSPESGENSKPDGESDSGPPRPTSPHVACENGERSLTAPRTSPRVPRLKTHRGGARRGG